MTFKKIIEMCCRNGFLRDNRGSLRVGPMGALLQENLRNEWLFGMVTNCDFNVFFNGQDSDGDSVEFVNNFCLQQLPFGIAKLVESGRNNGGFEEYFKDQKNMLLECSMFVAPSNSTQYFHQWQRHRKMWWRKFSAFPGRYLLTDIKTDSNGNQNVEIHVKYPWGEQLIESLNVTTEAPLLNLLEARDERKKVHPHCVTSTINFSSMFLNSLCDAYEENKTQGAILRFHRKIAPYKISFAISSSNKDTGQELRQLALYLCKKLRANNISSLLIPSAWKSSLESQWVAYDELGVPYNVLLNENTLKKGISLLRSRDTTLKEQVHVTDLPDYVEKIFKNY